MSISTTDRRGVEDRLRERETTLFADYGLVPVERRIEVPVSPADGARTDVRLLEFGADAAGPPVLLLHGIASVNAVAAPLLCHLRDRRVIAIDWPGHGLSGPMRLTRESSIRDHAVTVLTAVCDALEIDTADVVGHSMGAQFGIYFAVDVPARVRRLVVLGAPGAAFAGVRPTSAMRTLSVPGLGPALLRLPLPMSAYRRSLDDMLGDAVLDHHPSAMVEVGYLAGKGPAFAASVSSFFRALITPTHVRPHVPVTLDDLAGLCAPTLLVWGEQDIFLTPDAAADSITAIPDATLIRVTGGHAPWLDEPQTCGTAVAEFLSAADRVAPSTG
jgi:pimeloyl-ACP methyl ester carboxylesterase